MCFSDTQKSKDIYKILGRRRRERHRSETGEFMIKYKINQESGLGLSQCPITIVNMNRALMCTRHSGTDLHTSSLLILISRYYLESFFRWVN